jgi:hypothetical protein
MPLVVATTLSLGRFSLFSFGPIMSLVMLALFLWPGAWERLTAEAEPALKGSGTEGAVHPG